MVNRPNFQRLVERARNAPPLPCAVVYPCDPDSLQSAVSGQFAGYLAPVLVGPESRIADTAAQAGIDLSRLELIDTPDEPAAAAERAVGLAREGKVHTLIKGSLYPDDLMRVVAAAESGVRGPRRLSHAFYIDVPGYARSFILSDAVLNIAPNLAAKRDIVQNAIEFAHSLDVATPRVAVLAGVEGVTAAMPATAEAAALAKMATQGMISGGIVAGPLTVDSAMSLKAAQANGVKSDVAGQADILIAPTLEAGAILLRAITGMFEGLAAGVALGATVPIVLGGRNDSMEVRMASCVLAALIVQRRKADGLVSQAAPSSILNTVAPIPA